MGYKADNMPGRARAVVAAALERARAEPLQAAAVLAALAVGLYVVVYPFCLVTFPPLTDLPFHAAQTAVIRHYLDPAWHFRQQFTLHPLEVPYITTYCVGALLALVMPFTWAVKCMVIAMIALLPAGLAVLFHGMKKSALWGALLGLGLAWNQLVLWGFLNYVGALGLYAMSVGCALMVVDDPTRRRRAWLAVVLGLVFFTHVYRLPFAVLAVLATGAVMYPSTRRFRPLLLPMAPALALFGAWLLIRPAKLAGQIKLGFHTERLRELGDYVFSTYYRQTATGAREARIALVMGLSFVAVCALGAVVAWRRAGQEDRDRRWSAGVVALPLVLASGHLLAFLTLPMGIGTWWYVFPRELVAAVYVLLALAPDWPRAAWGRLGAVSLVAATAGQMAFLVATQWRRFEDLTWDFRAIARQVPRAPKLFYLIFDHKGTDRRHSPFTHLPAWIQAEKGGWLDFHFSSWDLYPVRYREGGVVPPSLPTSWEFTPQYFNVKRHGAWFDTFLVRIEVDPSPLFRADPTIHKIAQKGTWWLYRREPKDPTRADP